MIYGMIQDGAEQVAVTNASAMFNGTVIFNVLGDVHIMDLHSECITGNDATATTLQYQVSPTGLVATPISGASASLANLLKGAVVALDGTTLATAPSVYPNGVGLGQVARGIIIPTGTINLVLAVGATAGTWRHYLRYHALEPGAIVTPAF